MLFLPTYLITHYYLYTDLRGILISSTPTKMYLKRKKKQVFSLFLRRSGVRFTKFSVYKPIMFRSQLTIYYYVILGCRFIYQLKEFEIRPVIYKPL